jgi:ribosomal protein S18 acetylase RimI-like enzyme
MVEAVRPATSDDVARVAELARHAIAELSATKGGTVWARREGRVEPLEESVSASIGDPNGVSLVGTIDDAVVGYAIASVEVLPDGGRLARLTDLYVEPGAREVSVGELLLDTVISWATEGGCFGIDSIVLPGNRETKNFFESAGMVARAIIVHRALP